VAIATAVLLLVFHAPLLRFAAGLLVVDDPLPSTPPYVVIFGGDRRFDVAADLCRRGAARGVVLIEGYPERLVREGILPPRHEFAQQTLVSRGVGQDSITILTGGARSEWHAARLLAGWISRRPDASVAVLCDRFESRRQKRIIAAALGADKMRSVSVRALSDRRFDERNWWTSREGVKWVFICAVGAAYDYLCGEPDLSSPDWSPDEYEQTLRAALPAAGSEQQ
jgi:hypothetical protein